MAYCPRCGTENDPSVTRCPLCATPLPKLDLDGEPAWPRPDANDLARVWATGRQRRRGTLAALAAALVFPVVLLTGIDALVSGRVTWSWIPDLALLGVLALVVCGFTWFRRPVTLLTSWAVVTTAVLGVADALDGLPGWALPLGIPTAWWCFAVVAAVTVWIRKAKVQGWNLFGNLSLATALLCAGLEVFVRQFLAQPGGVWWSGIVGLVLVPIGLLLHVLQRFARPLNLRQSFHL